MNPELIPELMTLTFSLPAAVNLLLGTATGQTASFIGARLSNKKVQRKLSKGLRVAIENYPNLDDSTKHKLCSLVGNGTISDLLTPELEPLSNKTQLDWETALSQLPKPVAQGIVDTAAKTVEKMIREESPLGIQLVLKKLDDLPRQTTLPSEIRFDTSYLGQVCDASIDGTSNRALPLNNLPFLRNEFFTGREPLLSDIHSTFTDTAIMTLTQTINGMGGVGKSQVALEYAYRHLDSYNVIWWINAESSATILEDLTTFVTSRQLAEFYEDQRIISHKFTEWFETHPDGLLILDNVEDIDQISSFLPKGDGHSILLTTRLATQSLGTQVLVDVFSADEGIEFCQQRTSIQDRASAEKLCKRLFFFPLALEQACAYITNTPGMDLANYTELLGRRGLDVFEQKVSITQYHNSVLETFKLSMKRLRLEASSSLLNLIAYLAPDSVSRKQLETAVNALPEELAEAVQDDLLWHDVLRDITHFSLVKVKDGHLIIHRLLQEVIRHHQPNSHWLVTALKVVDLLLNAEQSSTTGGSQTLKALAHLGHVRVAMKDREVSGEALPLFADICRRCAKFLSKKDPALALTYAKEAYDFYSDRPEDKEDKLALAHTLHSMGLAHKMLREYPQAIDRYERALTLRQENLKDDDPRIAATENNLVIVYKNMGLFEKAYPMVQQNIARKSKTQGPEHPDTLKAKDTLANIWKHIDGRDKDALDLLVTTLKIREDTLGKDHAETALSYGNLGTFYSERQEFDRALSWFKKTRIIEVDEYGKDSLQVAQTLFNIGICRKGLDEPRKAARDFKKAYKIRLRILGNDDSLTRDVRAELAQLDD